MAYGGGSFLTQNKRLPGSYINFKSRDTNGTSYTKSGTVAAPVTLTVDSGGNLYITYNKDTAVSFELDSDANLYVSYDEESGTSFELDGNGNLYMISG